MLMDPAKTYGVVEREDLKNKFAYKILEYLWNDVSKFSREKWFVGNIKTLDELIKYFMEEKKVFADGVFK